MVLAASTRFEAQNADDFTIIGLLSTSDPTLNKGTVFITLTPQTISLTSAASSRRWTSACGPA